MLGWLMRRVGLIDITVGNATRLGASQRSATRRCASHHIATQRLSRWGTPGGLRAFSADGPLKRLYRPQVHRLLERHRREARRRSLCWPKNSLALAFPLSIASLVSERVCHSRDLISQYSSKTAASTTGGLTLGLLWTVVWDTPALMARHRARRTGSSPGSRHGDLR